MHYDLNGTQVAVLYVRTKCFVKRGFMSVKANLKAARAAIEDKDWDGALEFCKKILKSDKSCYQAFIFSGIAFKNQGRFGNAEQAYFKAIAIEQKQILAWRALADTYESEDPTWDADENSPSIDVDGSSYASKVEVLDVSIKRLNSYFYLIHHGDSKLRALYTGRLCMTILSLTRLYKQDLWLYSDAEFSMEAADEPLEMDEDVAPQEFLDKLDLRRVLVFSIANMDTYVPLIGEFIIPTFQQRLIPAVDDERKRLMKAKRSEEEDRLGRKWEKEDQSSWKSILHTEAEHNVAADFSNELHTFYKRVVSRFWLLTAEDMDRWHAYWLSALQSNTANLAEVKRAFLNQLDELVCKHPQCPEALFHSYGYLQLDEDVRAISPNHFVLDDHLVLQLSSAVVDPTHVTVHSSALHSVLLCGNSSEISYNPWVQWTHLHVHHSPSAKQLWLLRLYLDRCEASDASVRDLIDEIVRVWGVSFEASSVATSSPIAMLYFVRHCVDVSGQYKKALSMLQVLHDHVSVLRKKGFALAQLESYFSFLKVRAYIRMPDYKNALHLVQSLVDADVSAFGASVHALHLRCSVRKLQFDMTAFHNQQLWISHAGACRDAFVDQCRDVHKLISTWLDATSACSSGDLCTIDGVEAMSDCAWGLYLLRHAVSALRQRGRDHWADSISSFVGSSADSHQQSVHILDAIVADGNLYPRIAEYHQRLGLCLLETDSSLSQECLKHLLMSARGDSMSSLTFSGLALYYDRTGDVLRAQRCAEKAIALNPLSFYSREMSAMVFRIYGETKSSGAAHTLCTSVVRRTEKCIWAWVRLGYYHLRRASPELAEESAGVNPSAESDSNAVPDALKCFQQAIRQTSYDVLAWYGIAQCHQYMGKYTPAVKAYGQALKLIEEMHQSASEQWSVVRVNICVKLAQVISVFGEPGKAVALLVRTSTFVQDIKCVRMLHLWQTELARHIYGSARRALQQSQWDTGASMLLICSSFVRYLIDQLLDTPKEDRDSQWFTTLTGRYYLWAEIYLLFQDVPVMSSIEKSGLGTLIGRLVPQAFHPALKRVLLSEMNGLKGVVVSEGSLQLTAETIQSMLKRSVEVHRSLRVHTSDETDTATPHATSAASKAHFTVRMVSAQLSLIQHCSKYGLSTECGYKECIKDLRLLASNAVKISGDLIEAWRLMSLAYIGCRQFGRAQHCCIVASQLGPPKPGLWALLGHIYVHNKEYPLAVQCFRRGIVVDAEHAESWFGMGIAREMELRDHNGSLPRVTVRDCQFVGHCYELSVLHGERRLSRNRPYMLSSATAWMFAERFAEHSRKDGDDSTAAPARVSHGIDNGLLLLVERSLTHDSTATESSKLTPERLYHTAFVHALGGSVRELRGEFKKAATHYRKALECMESVLTVQPIGSQWPGERGFPHVSVGLTAIFGRLSCALARVLVLCGHGADALKYLTDGGDGGLSKDPRALCIRGMALALSIPASGSPDARKKMVMDGSRLLQQASSLFRSSAAPSQSQVKIAAKQYEILLCLGLLYNSVDDLSACQQSLKKAFEFGKNFPLVPELQTLAPLRTVPLELLALILLKRNQPPAEVNTVLQMIQDDVRTACDGMLSSRVDGLQAIVYGYWYYKNRTSPSAKILRSHLLTFLQKCIHTHPTKASLWLRLLRIVSAEEDIQLRSNAFPINISRRPSRHRGETAAIQFSPLDEILSDTHHNRELLLLLREARRSGCGGLSAMFDMAWQAALHQNPSKQLRDELVLQLQ